MTAVGGLPRLLITSGEPAGIGPELCAQLAGRQWPAQLVVLGDLELLRERARHCVPALQLRHWPGVAAGLPPAHTLDVLHVPLRAPAQPGRPHVDNAAYVLELLDRAIDACIGGEFDAMVTAPIHKGVICDSLATQPSIGAPIAFSGHTEYLAARTGCERVVMMLVGGGMRVALATTHLPLAEVAAAVTAEVVEHSLRILDADLRQRFGLTAPRILVAGLNPHAGEGGHLGREEIEVIIPVLERLRAEGMHLAGPLPADTLFVPHTLARGDAVLAMYHDQGLPVLKHASFGGGVNVTLGLPIIRTSVDHGTAFDLAGSGRADPGSLFAAVELALSMVAASAGRTAS